MTRLIDADALKKAIELEEGIFWDSYSSDELVISKKYIEDAPTVDIDLAEYSDKLWKEAYERGHKRGYKEGYEQAILDGKTNFSRQEGEWVNHRNDYGHNIADCSECGKAMQWHDEDEDGIPRYCWFCGAKMKEADNDK